MLTIREKIKKLEELFGVEKPDEIDLKEWITTLENMEAGYKKKSNDGIEAKELKRFIHESALKLSDDEIREQCKEYIRVLYGFNNYGCNLVHINELKECILKDYPDTKDEDMDIWFISAYESIRHARFTMLSVPIPTEDFIKLRAEGQIYIL